MAERRMFSKTIIDCDLFLDMPVTSQLLYFHLAMRADDDGFVDKPKSIMRVIGCKDDDIKILITNRFIVPFESGIVVIRHWKIHNYIQKDRYHETAHKQEKAMLTEKDNVYDLDTECIQSVSIMDTQVRLGKDSKELGKKEVEDKGEPDGSKPTRHKYGAYKNVLLSDEELSKLKEEIPNYSDYIERLSEYVASTGKKYKSHFVTIRAWARKDNAPKQRTDTNTEYQDFFDLVQRGAI